MCSIASSALTSRTGSGSRTSLTIWTAAGRLYVAAAIDLFSRRVVGWSMKAEMAARLVTDALMMAIWRRGKPDTLLHHSDKLNPPNIPARTSSG